MFTPDDLHLEDNGIPIYVQLREQLLSEIGAGRLRPGEQLPTMRQLAVALKVDLNTVRRAYEELERLGVLTILRAKGTYVALAPTAVDPQEAQARLDDLAHRTIAGARSIGIDPGRLARRVIEIVANPGETP